MVKINSGWDLINTSTQHRSFWGFFIIFLANVIANPLADLSKSILFYFPDLYAIGEKMELAYTEQVMALSNLKSWGEFVMAIVIMAFFPALFEEIFFRGAVQNLLERWWQKTPVGHYCNFPAVQFDPYVGLFVFKQGPAWFCIGIDVPAQ
ncbi:MAG: CPBP family intramembrane metalloprotease [Chitinophagaceae bacterium]|nr:CPBP family intramembrane metalloprotease [Chitinophagaceae bacterium]